MRIQITARGCEVPDSVRDRAEELILRLPRYEPALSGADVVFEVEAQTHRTEAVLSIDRADPVVARGEGSDFRGALDELYSRLSRILKKNRSLKRNHQARSLSESA